MTTTNPQAFQEAAFLERYGNLFDHSSWVVERVARRAPSADLHATFMQIVHDATRSEQLKLIRAHPELAGRAMTEGSLTSASKMEQASAGLNSLTAGELEQFESLNRDYAARFDFPFIICVRQTSKAGILAAMRRRLANEREEEIDEALHQIGEIVRLRLGDMT